MLKGNMAGMMKQIQKMQEDMQKTQEELSNKTISAESGGGMVKVVVNGQKQLISIAIDDEIIKSGDKEMIEDLVVAAVNKGLEAAGKMAESEMSNLTKGMLPPGFNIPGF